MIMKNLASKFTPSVVNLTVALFIAVSGMILISSCGEYSSVSGQEAYDAGYTIGRMISGN